MSEFTKEQAARMRENIEKLRDDTTICAPIAKIYCGDVEMLLAEIERLESEARG